jgi:hypothetical protein
MNAQVSSRSPTTPEIYPLMGTYSLIIYKDGSNVSVEIVEKLESGTFVLASTVISANGLITTRRCSDFQLASGTASSAQRGANVGRAAL